MTFDTCTKLNQKVRYTCVCVCVHTLPRLVPDVIRCAFFSFSVFALGEVGNFSKNRKEAPHINICLFTFRFACKLHNKYHCGRGTYFSAGAATGAASVKTSSLGCSRLALYSSRYSAGTYVMLNPPHHTHKHKHTHTHE